MEKSPDTERHAFVRRELARLVEQAALKRRSFRVIGALLFFSTGEGDAWLLELTEQDALRVATAGTPHDVVVNETEETLEIGWTHHFSIKGHTFLTKSYLDGSLGSCANCPTVDIGEALKQIRRQHSREELASIRTDGA